VERKRVRCVAALIAFALSPAVAAAESAPEPADEKLFLDEQPIVLTVSRLGQPVNEAPAAVTVIDRRMIEASGFRDIASVLRLVPGFQVAYARGNLPAVTYHGLSSVYPRRMQVLVDGRSIYTTAYGQVLWQNLPISVDDIERIEVVRGPNGASHGVNAFFATVNIITRAGGDDPGASAFAAIGNRSMRETTARYSAQAGPVGYRVTVSRRQDDRYASIADDARLTFVNARADYRVNARDEMVFHAGYGEGPQQEGDPAGGPYTPLRNTYPSNYFVDGKWRRVYDEDTELSVHVHHTVDDTSDQYRLRIPRVSTVLPVGGIDVPFNQNYRLVRNGAEVSGTLRPLQQLRIATAGEIRQDTARSAFYTGSDRMLDGYIYRLSGAAEYRLTPVWLLHAGAMIEKNYSVGTKVSPRLAVSYLPSPTHSFRVGVSRGYRSPTFLESHADTKWSFQGRLLNQEYRSPGNLAAESIDSLDVGYLFRKADWGFTLDSRYFYNRVHDIIELATVRFPAPSPELFGDARFREFGNRFEARQRGVELSGRWQLARNSWIVLNQTWTSTRANNIDYAASSPNNDTSALASHQFGNGYTGSVAYYRQNGMTWIGTTGTGRVPAYERVDARVARNIILGGHRVEWALVVQSMLGSYVEQTPGLTFDRRYFTTLRFRM
jgi:iron complex outermembrane recepter protein